LGDVDLEAGLAVIIGKGDKQAVVYFGPDALAALQDYIEARLNKGLDSPLFMRHDKAKNAGPNEHITTQTIRDVVSERAREALGYDHPKITPHALRHYFVTSIWKNTHDLMLAKELARHESVVTTQRYTHVEQDQLRDAHRRVFG
jgi:site-specific recombinase XerD